MTKDQRIDKAIALVEQADDLHGEALRMLNGASPWASEHIVNAQAHNLDAIAHMQTRPLTKKPKMKYNVCLCCGAKDGRAGVLIDGNCKNCYDTTTNKVVIHAELTRTKTEIARMIRKKTKKVPKRA